MKVLGVIPARYASSRFPGKPLAMIGGIPMVLRVWQQAGKCKELDHLIVATDDSRILDIVQNAGGTAMMTKAEHPSGTDRLCEVALAHPDYDVYINIQGDEPFLEPEVLSQLISAMRNQEQAEIATLVCPLRDTARLFSPNVVKVVKDEADFALYFSRLPIPFVRDEPDHHLWVQRFHFLQHIGIYAFRKEALQRISVQKAGKLEVAESLEQLRWIEVGMRILTLHTEAPGLAVDTPEDLILAEQFLSKQ